MLINFQRTGVSFWIVPAGLSLRVRWLVIQSRRGVGVQVGGIANCHGLPVENILRRNADIRRQRPAVYLTP